MMKTQNRYWTGYIKILFHLKSGMIYTGCFIENPLLVEFGNGFLTSDYIWHLSPDQALIRAQQKAEDFQNSLPDYITSEEKIRFAKEEVVKIETEINYSWLKPRYICFD